MRRQNKKVSNAGALLAYWHLVNGQYIDEISGTPHMLQDRSQIGIDGEYAYATSSTRAFNVCMPVNSTPIDFYMNNKTSWAGRVPDPGVNGVSPSYYNGKIRVEIEFYEPSSDLLKNLFCNMSHNNTSYRGTVLTRTDTDTYSWREHYTSYWRPPDWEQTFVSTAGYSASNPLRLILDLTEDNYRISFYNISGTKLYDSGVRNCLSSSSSNRQTAYMHSNWSSESVLVYVKYQKIYDGTLLSDFGI